MKRVFSVLATSLLLATPGLAQQLINGTFEQGGFGWTNHPTTSGSGWSFADIDGDSDLELVMDGTTLTNSGDNVLFLQDLSTEHLDLSYGIALAADIVATNLNGDCRAFIKIEFGTNDMVNGSGGGNLFSISSEYTPATYASSNDMRQHTILLISGPTLSNTLAGFGTTYANLTWVRGTLFLRRFDDTNNATGSAYFDNISFGLVSDSYAVPGVPGGAFEYGLWSWLNNPVTAGNESSTSVRDRDGDGDAELEIAPDGLTSQYSSHLVIWETDARMIDFTQGVSLTADVGATNLAPGLRAFFKLEFVTNRAPNSAGFDVVDAVSSEYDPSTYATNNDTRLGITISKSYAELTNDLAGFGITPDALTVLRTVLFVFQFGTNDSPVSGTGWFDNVKLNFAFRDQPNVTATQLDSGGARLTWASLTGETYRVQENSSTDDYQWSNVAASVEGLAGSTSYTNPLSTAPRFIRVIRNK